MPKAKKYLFGICWIKPQTLPDPEGKYSIGHFHTAWGCALFDRDGKVIPLWYTEDWVTSVGNGRWALVMPDGEVLRDTLVSKNSLEGGGILQSFAPVPDEWLEAWAEALTKEKISDAYREWIEEIVSSQEQAAKDNRHYSPGAKMWLNLYAAGMVQAIDPLHRQPRQIDWTPALIAQWQSEVAAYQEQQQKAEAAAKNKGKLSSGKERPVLKKAKAKRLPY